MGEGWNHHEEYQTRFRLHKSASLMTADAARRLFLGPHQPNKSAMQVGVLPYPTLSTHTLTHPVHTHPINTHPINTSTHTLSTHQHTHTDTHCQHTPCQHTVTHCQHIPCQHTLLTHTLLTHTLSTHTVNAPCQHTLSTHTLAHLINTHTNIPHHHPITLLTPY